jgi:hypothetical protein
MGKPSKWEGLLLERLKESLLSYRVRDPGVIYIHMFGKPVWYWFFRFPRRRLRR